MTQMIGFLVLFFLMFLNLCCLWLGLYGLAMASNDNKKMMAATLSTLSILFLVLQIVLTR